MARSARRASPRKRWKGWGRRPGGSARRQSVFDARGRAYKLYHERGDRRAAADTFEVSELNLMPEAKGIVSSMWFLNGQDDPRKKKK